MAARSRIFALEGLRKPQPIQSPDYPFVYDPALQVHLLPGLDGANRPLIESRDDILSMAITRVATWSRSPTDEMSNVQDDEHTMND